MSLGGSEIIVIALVAVLIFGPDKLPTLFRLLGRVTAEIKDFQQMATNEFEKVANSEPVSDKRKEKVERATYVEPDGPVAPILDED